MNSGNPWGNFNHVFGQLPATQYDNSGQHIHPSTGLQHSVPSHSGNVINQPRVIGLSGAVSYTPAINTGAVYLDPGLQTQQAYKPVISQPLTLPQAIPSTQVWGSHVQTGQSYNTIDTASLGLAIEPPPAHTGRAPISPVIFKQHPDHQSVITLAQGHHYSKPLTSEAPVLNTFHEQRHSQQYSRHNTPYVSQPTSQSTNFRSCGHVYTASNMANYNTTEQFNVNISLQDLAEMHSPQSIVPQMQHSPHGQNSPHASVHHSPHAPAHHSPHSVPQHSPQPNITSSMQNQPVAVQAVADSTTKPRKKSRKKPKQSQDEVPIDSLKTTENAMLFSPQHLPFTPEKEAEVAQRSIMIEQFSEPMQMQEIHQVSDPQFMAYEDESPTYITSEYGNTYNINPDQMNIVIYNPEGNSGNAAVEDDLEDEFGHLNKQPELPRSEKPKKISPKKDEKPDLPPPPQSAPKLAASSSFQRSFLSFLEGKKQETLSSVTNSTVSKKPELPKYVPEPRRPKPALTESKESKNTLDAKDSSKLTASSMPKLATDNEENEQELDKAVLNALNKLDDSPDSEPPDIVQKSRGTPRGRGRGRRGGVRGRSTRQASIDSLDVVEDSNGADSPASFSNSQTPSPAPPPRRASSARKAAVQVKKKLKRQVSSQSDSGTESESTSTYGTAGASDQGSESEEAYDSDKDPSWDPQGETLGKKKDGDTDDEIAGPGYGGRRSRGRGKRFKPMAKPSIRGRGRGASRSAADSSTPKTSSRSVTSAKVPATSIFKNPGVLDSNPCHSYQKGDFVLDRRDLTKYDNFPIWRIDAGRLLQKFDPMHQDGVLVHKSLSTYSSWTDNIRYQYKAIMVEHRSRVRNTDIVKVLEQYLPKPETESANDEIMLEKYTVYLQILTSQAMEPNFLMAVMQEQDEYYSGPLEHIDGELESRKDVIMTRVSWDDSFKKNLEWYPYVNIMARPNMKAACKGCKSCPEPAVKMVQLYGDPYRRDTLTPDDSCPSKPEKLDIPVCMKASDFLTSYHSIHHFKFNLYKRCKAKVDMLREEKEDIENQEILDKCLQNQAWVKKLFSEFNELISPFKKTS